MKINRYNYEEFFILYMDNELLPEDRLAVEAFIQQHPDLKEELELLQQFKLSPDTDAIYAGKEELMKADGETPLTESNVQEWMVLAVDGELNDTQIARLQSFLQSAPELQKEFALLQMTKIPAEEIVFADKSSLYRHEEKVRVIPWRRIAAAVILLVAGLGTYTFVTRKKGAEVLPVAGTNKGVKPGKLNPETSNPESVKEQENAIADNNQQIVQPVNTDNPNTNSTSNQVNPSIRPDKKIKTDLVVSPVKKDQPIQVAYKAETPVPEKELAVVHDNNLPKPEYNQSVIRNMDPQQHNAASSNVAALQADKLNPEAALTVTKTNPAALYSGGNENNNTVAASEPEGSKGGKLRGFIRKVGRTFEKRTNISSSDESRLLIAGLSFKRN